MAEARRASKQIFSPDPFTKVVCIQEPDGQCIKESISVSKLRVKYSRSVFTLDGSNEENLETELAVDDDGRLPDLKRQLEKVNWIAPELNIMASNMLDTIQSLERNTYK